MDFSYYTEEMNTLQILSFFHGGLFDLLLTTVLTLLFWYILCLKVVYFIFVVIVLYYYKYYLYLCYCIYIIWKTKDRDYIVRVNEHKLRSLKKSGYTTPCCLQKSDGSLGGRLFKLIKSRKK